MTPVESTDPGSERPERSERRLSRRTAVRGIGLASLGMLAAPLLAACGASATTTVAGSTSAAASATTASAAATTAAATTASTTKAAAAAATTSTATVQGKNPTGKKGEVTWLTRTTLSEENWEKKVAIPAFQKLSPGITINLIVAPWAQFDPKLFTLFAAGTPVDIWTHWGQSGFADYVHKGMVADLTSYINTDHYDLTAFQPGLTDIYKVGGKYMGLPNDTTFGMPMFYDVDLFQKAGVTAPPQDWAKPWTWDEFVAAGHKLTQNYGAPVAVYGLNMSTDLQLLARLGGVDLFTWDVVANGGTLKPTDYHADDPGVLTAVQSVYDLIFKEKVMPTSQLSSALSAGNLDPFRAQRLATNWDGGWQYWNYKPEIHNFKWAPAADPILKTNNTTEYTDPWMMCSKSIDPTSTWKFMQYLLSEDGQLAYMSATGAPPGNAKVAEKWLADFTAPTGLTVDQLKTVTQGALTHGKESFNHLLVGYDEIATAETQAMGQVWSGKVSPHDGLAQAQQQVGAVLTKLASQS